MDATFLRSLQHKGYMTTNAAREFLRKTMGYDVSDDLVEQTRIRINRELDFADIEIRRMRSPVMHIDSYVALVNKQREDVVAQSLAQKHPSSHPEYLRRLMSAMLQSGEEANNGGSLSEAEAIRIGRCWDDGFDTSMDLMAHECTAALDHLLKDSWIIQHPEREGYYTLGVRTLMEFHDEILEMELPDEMRSLLEQYL